MSLYINIIFWVSFVVSLVTFVYSVKKKRVDLIQCLPFLMWQFLMSIPYYLQSSNMEELPALWQMIGIEIVNFVLAIYILIPKHNLQIHIKMQNKGLSRLYALLNSGYFYTAIFIVIMVYHIIALEGNIPLVEKLKGHGEVLIQMREDAGKLLDVPFYMKYFFRWITNFVAPIAIIMFWNKKQYFMVVLQLVFAVIYAKIKDANGPLLTFLAVLAVYFGIKYYSKINKKIWVIIFVGALILSIRPIIFFSTNEYSAFRYHYVELTGEPMARQMQFIEYPEGFPEDYRNYNYFLRRVILLPSAVSHEWYSYIDAHKEYFGYTDLLPSSKSREADVVVKTSPANIVGLWSSEGKWDVGQTISSNCSMDADAFARGGWLSVIITSILFGGLIYVLTLFRNKKSIISEALYISAIVIITTAISSASLHALLIAQGVLPLLLGLIAVFIISSGVEYEEIN